MNREACGDEVMQVSAQEPLLDTSDGSLARSAAPSPSRVESLDIFRGLAVAGMILVDNPGHEEKAYWPLRHAEWNGWTAADLVFPSFLFLVGVSIVLSVSARLRRGESRRDILVHAIRRTWILVALGLFLNGFPLFHLADWRVEGVLQRIALCYLFTAILVLWSDVRGQLASIAICLFGYWALMRLAPVPGFGVPGRDVPFLDRQGNIVAWLDRELFMGRLYDTTRDPEGVLSTIPAIGTCLVGALTGHWLRSHRKARVKAAWMAAAGGAAVLAGLLWDRWFPINKNLWTSSFVVLTSGFALLVLSILYWVLEVRRWRGAWTTPFLVLGMNPIAGFAADALVYGPADAVHFTSPDGRTTDVHELLAEALLEPGLDPAVASLLYSLGAVALAWVLLWLLWRKRVFLKI